MSRGDFAGTACKIGRTRKQVGDVDTSLDIYLNLIYILIHIISFREVIPVTDTAKLFTTGRSQAVRLPMQYRFDGNEVFIRREPATGDVVLSRRPDSWAGFFALDATTKVPANFMSKADRNQGRNKPDPFDDAAS